MGVYIKCIEMPTTEQGVRTINIYADGVVTNYAEVTIGKAVPVPPHGRLIDEDVLIKTAHNQWPLPIDFLKLLELVPTVIPADGKDTDVHTREEGE